VTLKLGFGVSHNHKVIKLCTIRSGDSENPTLEPNITSIGKPVEKLWPFLYIQHIYPTHFCISDILEFIKPQTVPLNPPIPKTLAQNQTWSGSDAPFVRYSPLNYTVTLTEVQGHLRSSKAELFDTAHTTLYSSSIVTMRLSITVSEI